MFLYADDIILLSPSVGKLQLLLTYGEHELDYLNMSINTKKLVALELDIDLINHVVV